LPRPDDTKPCVPREYVVRPPGRQPRGKSMVSLVNSHTNATRIGWHLWEIDLRFAPGLGRSPHCSLIRATPSLKENATAAGPCHAPPTAAPEASALFSSGDRSHSSGAASTRLRRAALARVFPGPSWLCILPPLPLPASLPRAILQRVARPDLRPAHSWLPEERPSCRKDRG